MILGCLFLGFSRLGGKRSVGGGLLRVFRLGKRRKSACVVGRLFLVKKIAHCWGLGRFPTMASLDAVASLDPQNLIARGSHFRRVCSDTAAFVIPLGKDAMGEILARRGDRKKRRDGAFPANNCGGRLDPRARPSSLRSGLANRSRVTKAKRLTCALPRLRQSAQSRTVRRGPRNDWNSSMRFSTPQEWQTLRAAAAGASAMKASAMNTE